ncbi:hypothetical protein LO762_02630 [Actinocorallia sp. API 0066]|uniref:hypothetical protein n=1 Tax=Actinocorallia sp. API 0066 TaxID=2896846 RepID=UPI001E5082A4|nr:hypothetical protein [Actinocorallia sp. API 0066]MCD0448098.1 hypothetical protein [Actinocorallia sp. API 0066]
MTLLHEELAHERIRLLQEEVAALQWAAEVRRSRREALRAAARDTGRATRQEARIRLRGLRSLLTR